MGWSGQVDPQNLRQQRVEKILSQTLPGYIIPKPPLHLYFLIKIGRLPTRPAAQVVTELHHKMTP